MAKGMEMRLYFHPLSSNSRRVTMTAQQLGLELDLIVIDLLKSEHSDPEFLKFNPNGKVPLLEDGGFYLWESHAIMQYLADRCPGQDLYPREVRARADVNRWLFWSAYHFTPPSASSAEKGFRRRWWVDQEIPIQSRFDVASPCSRQRPGCSTTMSLVGNGSLRTS